MDSLFNDITMKLIRIRNRIARLQNLLGEVRAQKYAFKWTYLALDLSLRCTWILPLVWDREHNVPRYKDGRRIRWWLTVGPVAAFMAATLLAGLKHLIFDNLEDSLMCFKLVAGL